MIATSDETLAVRLLIHALKVEDLGMHVTGGLIREASSRLAPGYVPADAHGGLENWIKRWTIEQLDLPAEDRLALLARLDE